MVSGGTSLAVFGSSMALTVAVVDKSIRAQEHKSTMARHDLFVSVAFFIFRAFRGKSIKFGFRFHPSRPAGTKYHH
jgi:hypothetical protein